jgi:hypothetical protein
MIPKAQGAFEYLMSYGWAVLVVVVLGIVLYNLGVFSPSQPSVFTGFAFLKPLSASVLPVDANNALITLQLGNAGGNDFQISSTNLVSAGLTCNYSLSEARNSDETTISTAYPFSVPAGQSVKVVYWANGTGCGKSSGAQFNYQLSFSGTDSFGINQLDSGKILVKAKTCQRPYNGLVGLWHFREGLGTVLGDDSGNGNSGVLKNSPAWSAGKIGTALSFDGTSGFVNLSASSGLNVSYGTWEAWIYPTSFTDHQYHTVIAKAYATAWWFGLYQNTGRIQVWVNGSAKQSTGAVQLNQWSHIVATWDGSVVNYYINGRLDSQSSAVGIPAQNSEYAYVGTEREGGSLMYYFTGKIDELAIWNRALSASEVNSIYSCVP